MIEKALSKLLPGDKGVIYILNNDKEVRGKLLDLGLTPGAEVMVVREAPFGGPLTVRSRGCDLAVRMKEAEKILTKCLTFPIKEK